MTSLTSVALGCDPDGFEAELLELAAAARANSGVVLLRPPFYAAIWLIAFALGASGWLIAVGEQLSCRARRSRRKQAATFGEQVQK